jgi:hypothetical protein
LNPLERVASGEIAGRLRVRLSTGSTNARVNDDCFNHCHYVDPQRKIGSVQCLSLECADL